MIRSDHPDIRVMFLTAFEDRTAILATVLACAGGYVLKEINSERLVHAVRAVASGLTVADPGFARAFVDHIHGLVAGAPPDREDLRLSAQERRVLSLVAEGKTNKEIAAEMHLSPKTVKNYLSNVFEKLNVSRRALAAARFAAAPHE